MLKSKFRRDSDDMFGSEGVNPMESIANLADVMLVLAVGIMLALIIAWKVDISTVSGNDSSSGQSSDEMVEVEADTIGEGNEDSTDAIDSGLEEAGKVYVDSDGNYYMLKSK